MPDFARKGKSPLSCLQELDQTNETALPGLQLGNQGMQQMCPDIGFEKENVFLLCLDALALSDMLFDFLCTFIVKNLRKPGFGH